MGILGLEPSAQPAVIDPVGGRILSFAELIATARDVAAAIGSEKRLAFLIARNDIPTAIAYVGALLGGHAVALLDADGPDEAVAALVNAYRPSWAVGGSGLASWLNERGVVINTARAIDGCELVQTALEDPPAIHPELALMLTTSGTTGSRKFVRLSARNVESNASSIARCLDLSHEDRPITSLPIHYSFGLSVVNSHWLVGAPIVVTGDGVLQRSFWDTFDEQRCTSLAGVPYTYQMLERVGFREMELPSLRSLQQAGGALDRRLKEVYANHMLGRGGRFFVMYGQTEATARIAYVPPARLLQKLDSAGLAIPDGRLSIDAGDPSPVSAGTVGEVIYEGPNVMLGYASGAEDLRLGDDLGGILRTGDLGYLDEEGFLHLVGRSKRIAKVYGRRVNLDEVEAIARESGPAAVVGAEDAVVVVCGFGTPESVRSFGRDLAQRLGLHPSAVRVRWVETVPTTTSGKIDYEEVQRWVG